MEQTAGWGRAQGGVAVMDGLCCRLREVFVMLGLWKLVPSITRQFA